MGQKNIIEFPAINLKAGIDSFGDKEVGVFFSKDIDPDTDPFGLRAQLRPTKEVSQASLATMNDIPKWIVKGNGGNIYMLSSTNELFEAIGTAWTRVNVSGQVGTGQGLVEYNDDIFYVQTTYVGMYDGASFVDNWQTRSAAISTNGPAIKFIGKFFVGSGRYIDSWDGVTWKGMDLTLPITETVVALTVWNDFLVIGCSSGNIYFWDGTSPTYNDVKMLPGAQTLSAVTEFLNNLYVFGGLNGSIFVYDGSEFVERTRIPDINDTSFTTFSVSIWPGAVTPWNNKIYFLVGISSDPRSIRTKSGVWSYNPAVDQLKLEFTVSSGQMSGNNFGIGALYYTGSSKLYIGYKDLNAGSDGAYIDIVGTSSVGSTQGCYIITSEVMPVEFALAFLRRLYINCSLFDSNASTAKIIAAIKFDDESELRVTTYFTASTGCTATKITTGSNVALLQEGDMLEIMEGPSARDVRFIVSADNSLSPKEIVVSEPFSTTPVNGQSSFLVYRFQKVGEISYTDQVTLKSFEVMKECKKVWIYLEIREASTGLRTALKKAALDFMQRPNS